MRTRLIAAALSVILASGPFIPVAMAHSSEEHSGGHDAAVPQTAEGEGVVKAVDAKGGKVTLQHGPIAALNWPSMTMTFKVASAAVLDNVSVGKKVHFMLKNDNGKPVVTEIHPL